MTNKVFAYARVSTKGQKLESQLDALKKHGYDEIFIDKASGVKENRPELENLKTKLRKGDTILIYRLDRIGRSLKHLIEITNEFNDMGVELISINDKIDTTSPMGKLIFHISAAYANFERDLIRDRTIDGLRAAISRGRKGGRKKGFTKEVIMKCTTIYQEYKKKEKSVEALCKEYQVAKSTFYRFRAEQLKRSEIQYDAFEKRV
ncbi:recombinase family protein [Thiotrichales bacterium 19X7-9]|nr:recombinase family protein [Thiotrichales bacterium 19X7-9]